tara:strand:+ start:118 stop:279 length:162 start_codon:yes stop_codon:yes gene_type:complete
MKKVKNDQHTRDMVDFVKENVDTSNNPPKIQNPNPSTYGTSHYNQNPNQYTSY